MKTDVFSIYACVVFWINSIMCAIKSYLRRQRNVYTCLMFRIICHISCAENAFQPFIPTTIILTVVLLVVVIVLCIHV